jgi:hypothetical protein
MQDDKACFSRVGIKKAYDYSLTFADMQKLQLLRQKILRTLSVLDACLAVAKGCERLCQRLDALKVTTANEMIFAGLMAYEDEINRHRRGLTTLLDYSSGTATLVCPPFLLNMFMKFSI